jgi:FkbM family methyltransferase
VDAQLLAFDRMTGRFSGTNWVERLAVAAMQIGVKATAPIHYRGLSLGCRVLRAGLVEREIVVTLTEDSRFAFPFADGYWTRLLDSDASYEPEIEAFLRAIANVDYDFVDCGANFGFWSILATSRVYGGHKALAIEASASNAARLAANAQLNADRFRVLHRAIGRIDGGTAWVAGSKHEAMTTAGVAAGTGQEVSVVSLDGLMKRGLLRADRPLVVKLDVEGMEIEAIRGAERLLRGDVVLICEDHRSDRSHRVSRYLMSRTRCSLLVFHQGQFMRLVDASELRPLKARASPGYNVFAVTPFWERQLAVAGMIGVGNARH